MNLDINISTTPFPFNSVHFPSNSLRCTSGSDRWYQMYYIADVQGIRNSEETSETSWVGHLSFVEYFLKLFWFFSAVYLCFVKPHQMLAPILFSVNMGDGTLKDVILLYTRREEVEIFDKNEVGDYLWISATCQVDNRKWAIMTRKVIKGEK